MTEKSPLWCPQDKPHGPHRERNEFGGINTCTGRPEPVTPSLTAIIATVQATPPTDDEREAMHHIAASLFPFDGSDPDTVIECRRRCAEAIESYLAGIRHRAPITDDEREAVAQVIADSFFAMEAGQAWDAEGPDSYGRPEPSAGDMQLAHDVVASDVWRNRHRGPITDEMARQHVDYQELRGSAARTAFMRGWRAAREAARKEER